MNTFKSHLKDKKFSQLYFFHGDEVFLSDYYAKKLKSNLVEEGDDFNYIKLSPEDSHMFQEAVEAGPMMADKKLVVVKGRNFSEEIKSDFLNLISEILEDIPSYTYVLFICGGIDKKSKIYKLLSTKCTTCVFDSQKSEDVITWIGKVTRSKGKNIDRDAAMLLTTYAGLDMTNLITEIDKLVAYAGAEANITQKMIDAIVIKNIDSIVFKLIDEALAGKNDNAFIIFNDLKVKKEQPIAINGAITKYMTDILRYKIMKQDNIPVKTICDTLKLRSPYQQKKYLGYDSKLSEKYLRKMINKCEWLDTEIKSGGIDGYTGLGILIAEMMAF